MSDTRTLEQRQYEAQMEANNANFNLDEVKEEIARQAKRFADIMASPDFQQMVLALWEGARAASRKSGLSVEGFAKTLFSAQAATKGEAWDDHAMHLRLLQEREAMERSKREADAESGAGYVPHSSCQCGAKEYCSRCLKKTSISAPPELLTYVKTRSENDAKMSGVNSVARGAPNQDTSVHAQVGVKLGEAVRAFADAALKLGAVAPWLGETCGDTARDIAKQAEALGYRADTLKRFVAP